MKKKISFLLIFLFLISILNARYNIKEYDKNLISPEGSYYHVMIKNDAKRYFSHGFEIKEQIKDGINYFETGRQNFTKYLYPRIIALYYLITDYDLYEDNSRDKVKVGIHFNYLIFQILLYYLSLLFLFFQIQKLIPNKQLFLLILFLGIEPTIFQYHGSFWSESIFFSILLILIGLILNDTEKISRYMFIGLFLGLLSLQRSNGFFYIIPIIFYFFLIRGFKFKKKLFSLLLGYLTILIIVGYHNYVRSNKFYILPNEVKAVLHSYFLPQILSIDKIDREKMLTKNILKENKVIVDYEVLNKLDYSRYAFFFCENNEKREDYEYLKICNYLEQRSYYLILTNIIPSTLYWIKQSAHFGLLNPFHIYSDHQFSSSKIYYRSDLHGTFIPYRIIYSLFIYLISIIGLFEVFRQGNKKILFFSCISIIYFFLILSWHGNTRYFVPILFYLSFFFSFGFIKIYEIIKKHLISNLTKQ